MIEAAGKLAMPGLINGHFHSQANLLAGALANRPLELFMLFEVPPGGDGGARSAARLPADHARRDRDAEGRRYGGARRRVPQSAIRRKDSMLGADARLCGQRAARDGLDQSPEPGRVREAAVPRRDCFRPTSAPRWTARRARRTHELADLYRWYHATWHGAENGRLRIAVSNSAPQRVSEDYFAFLSAFSREHDLPFNIHMLETKTQRVLGQTRWGKSLIRHVHDLGFLDERVMVIHAIWVDDDDIALMADAGCVVAHNPMCNLKLGSGIMPFRKLRDAGIPIALGSRRDARPTTPPTCGRSPRWRA